jgi:hypothetical protein
VPVGGVATAVLIATLGVWIADVQGWLFKKVHSEKYLSALAELHPPGANCQGGRGWVFAQTPTELPLPTQLVTFFDRAGLAGVG